MLKPTLAAVGVAIQCFNGKNNIVIVAAKLNPTTHLSSKSPAFIGDNSSCNLKRVTLFACRVNECFGSGLGLSMGKAAGLQFFREFQGVERDGGYFESLKDGAS